MWRWIQNQSRGRCEVLSAPASDRHSLLAYVGDVRHRLFGDGERGGIRGDHLGPGTPSALSALAIARGDLPAAKFTEDAADYHRFDFVHLPLTTLPLPQSIAIRFPTRAATALICSSGF
jgi:hypothetical protein